MNAVVPLAAAQRAHAPPRLALLGTGVVGSAFVARWQRLKRNGVALPEIEWLANSRGLRHCYGDAAHAFEAATHLGHAESTVDPEAGIEALRRGDIVIDATASDAVAGKHAAWLASGLHVVTANKLGAGSSLERAQAVVRAALAGGAVYGDSATVGAGLPLLRSLRELVAGGDRIHRVEGVLSGSLAWLFHHFDGMRPFCGFVREARRLGFTEPDPRQDLSGEDVRRKLLILARAAGLPLQSEEVRVHSLVPEALASLEGSEVDGELPQLDAALADAYKQAYRNGCKLRFLGRFDARGAQVGLQSLPADHPLCGGAGTDNRVAIFSDRYCDQPLLIQGPGAGAEVTAAALLDDVLRTVRRS